jgi:hypothetical protein
MNEMYTSLLERPDAPATRWRHSVGKLLLLGALTSSSLAFAQSPGGVAPAAWYRADGAAQVFSDAGTTAATNNALLHQWNEAQGNGYNLLQASSGGKPVYSNATTLANFNPTITFDGYNDFMQFTAGPGINVIDRADGTLYAAGYVNVQKRNGFVGFHPTMDYPGLHEFSDNKLLFFTGGPGYQGKSADVMAAKSYFTAGTGWENGGGSSSGYAGATVSLNGSRTSYNGTQLNNANLSTGARDLRIGGDSNYGAFSGQLNEILVFDARLTPTEMDQVESYLAIKYGSTYAAGTRDYKNASGGTVWTATANAGYNYNLAGIANDGALNQKQSWSTNSNREVLISTAGLANTNAGNATALTAGQYLVWGDNGLSKTPTVAIAGITGISHRFAAIWKVQNTSSVGTVRIAWVKNLANLSLIQSDDATFSSTDDITSMTGNEIIVNGTVYNYADVVLGNGEYFTFAAKVAAPGGVSGPAVWLRANDGTTVTGTTVNGWVNYGNSGGVAGQLSRTATLKWALPKYGANVHNFNPAIIDDVPGTNDGSLLLEDVFPATGQRPLSSFILQSHPNVTTANNMISFSSLKQTYGALESPYMASYGATRSWFYWQGVYESAPVFPGSQKRQNNVSYINSFYVPQWVSGSTHQTTVGLNGATANTPAYSINPTSLPFGNQLFIFGDGNHNNNSGGKTSEVITYDRVLTATEKQQVNSYLAIKYGITLTTDAGTAVASYLNSNADTVWNATANNGYNNNIVGIANDMNSSLHQKQSKSNKTGQQLLIGTTGLNNSNELNTTGLSDGQFIVVGDNGLAMVPSVSLSGVPGVNFRFGGVWKVQNTGSVGTVRVAWPTGLPNLTFIQSSNATFATVNVYESMAANVASVNGVAYNYADVTLTDGQYFTFATQLNGPAGVALNLRVWLKSDAGFSPEQWNDFSGEGNHYTQTNDTRKPYVAAAQYNFNPMVDFGTTGSDARFMAVPSGKPYSANGTNSTIFTATTSRDGSGYTDIIGFNGTTTGSGLVNANTPVFTKLGSNLVMYPYATAPSLSSIKLNRVYLDDVSFTVGTAGIKYAQNGDTASVNSTVSAGNALHANGSILGAQPEVRNGNIGEVIAYERDLTEAEKQRVRSYVAVKYGLTLLHDYIASNGTTVFWSIDDNEGFNNNIASIARDDYGSLNQKQSWSINSQNEVLISTSGLSNSNALNTVIMDDQRFLAWGDNGRSKGPATPITGITDVNTRFGALWKVQNTNSVGTVRVAWKKGYENLKLIQSSDTTINSSDVVTAMSNTQIINGVEYAYADVTMNDGQYFTFAAFLQAPGGVTAGLSHWYRADKYLQTNGDSTEVTSWTDFTSGVASEQIESEGLPHFKAGDTTYFNFNPGVNFTSATQKLGNISTQTLTSLDFDIFTTTKEGMSGSRFFNIGMDNTTFNGNNWDHPGLYVSGTIARRSNTGGALILANPGSVDFASNQPSIMYHTFGDLSMAKGLNGAVLGTASSHTARGMVTGGHIFGANNGGGTSGDDGGFVGNIGELIIYGAGTITAAERNKVDAYLAIKYGVTLSNTNNYTTSQGTVVWNAATNAGFYNNVAGIGHDYISDLHQKQSRSQRDNTNGQVIMSLGELAATNAGNTGAVEDGQFLLWGDNNVTQAMTAAASTYTTFSYAGGTNNGRRMNRVWKVQNTDVDQPMQVLFPRNSVGTATLPTGDACGSYAILFAADSAMTTNLVAVPLGLTEDSVQYIVSHTFPDGMSYFSFGKVTPLDNGNIYLPSVVESSASYNDNCGVGEWKHYHKTGDVTEKMFGAAGFTNTQLDSLELTITPDGTGYDDGTRITSLMPRITYVLNNNTAPLSTGKVKVYYSADELAATSVPGYVTQGWFKYDGDADAVLADVYDDGVFETGRAVGLTPDATGVEDGVNYVEFHGISSLSSFVYLSSTENLGTVLPVNLLYFSAEKQQSNALLSWKTATEVKSSGFVIERSNDARTWAEIGFVASKTNPGKELSYNFLDEKPMRGDNFYRLKQLDIDGAFEYSQVQLVRFDKAQQLQIVPNPASSDFVIKGLHGNNNIAIANVAGQVLVNTRTEGVGEQLIQVAHLPAGMYFVTVKNDDGSFEVHKVVKD